MDAKDMATTEEEKDAFLAQIAAEEKRKLDVHDELVDALQILLKEAERIYAVAYYSASFDHRHNIHFNVARAVLAKAKGAA